MKERRIAYNSFVFVLLIFLYSVTTLFSLVMNQGLLITITSILFIGPAIVWNFNKINRKTLIVIFISVMVMGVLMIHRNVFSSNAEAITDVMLKFGTIGIMSLFVGTFSINHENIRKWFDIMSIVCFALTFVYLVLIRGDFRLSMRFGYAMLPSTIWFLYEFIDRKKIGWLLLFIVSLLSLVIYGSRGTLLSIGLLLALLSAKRKWWWMLIMVLIIVVFLNFFIDSLEFFLNWLAELSGSKKITKLITLFNGDLAESSTGRDWIYERCITLFNESPMGKGVAFWENDPYLNGLFPHNYFLQAAVEFGVVGLIISVILFVTLFVRNFTVLDTEFPYYVVLFSICFGRLLVSSTYWDRPEFWLLLGYALINHSRIKLA